MTPAPALPPVSLESAYVSALALAAKPAEDPISVLNRKATVAEKLAAIEALHRSLPTAPQARRTKGEEALRKTASTAGEAPEVRASALTHLGYAVPVVGDALARENAVRTLLLALLDPAYRVPALRGLAPASHDLPPAVEGDFESGLLDLLDLRLSVEERVTALLALDGFVRAREDLSRRRPDLVAAVETRVLAPVAANPAAFAAARTPGERSLALAVIWHAARNRSAAGDDSTTVKVNALFTALIPLEPDQDVKDELAAYLAAPAPKLLP